MSTMQRAVLLGLGSMRATSRVAAALHRAPASQRRALRVLASAANSGSGSSTPPCSSSAADEQRRRLIMQAFARQQAMGAGADALPRSGLLRRLLLSGAAAAALLAAAVWPRPAAAFRMPGGMWGSQPPAAVAPVAVDAVPATMENKVSRCHWVGWPTDRKAGMRLHSAGLLSRSQAQALHLCP